MSNTPIKIGYCLSLSGGLAANGHTARLAHQVWQERVNARGGLLGREVELICVDDTSDAATVAGIYEKLLSEEKADLLLGGYGNNSISPAMPLVMENGKFLVGLMGLGVNIDFEYDRFFAMIPTGTDPNSALTEGFFETASKQTPRPTTVAIVAADAPFSKNPILGARANAAKNGLEVVLETKYPLTTTDFAPYLREAQQSSPDVLFYCAYLNDSVGLIRAIAESEMNPSLVGGAMIGPQSSAVQTQLGPVINGIVNYEYWLPVPAMNFPGVRDLITDYQRRAKGTPADDLGYYVAPFAYAQAQVLEQAVEGTGGLNDADLAEFAREATFATVVGDVKFGRLGEWAAPRVLTVQFRGIGSTDIADFARPEARVVVAPASYASGELAGRSVPRRRRRPMNVLGSAAIVQSTDRARAVSRFAVIFGAPPLHEFQIDGRDLSVSVFPGVSVLAGSSSALRPLTDLRATLFVGSLAEAEAELRAGGWTTEGSLGGGASLLARDLDGNLLEFVENPGAPE